MGRQAGPDLVPATEFLTKEATLNTIPEFPSDREQPDVSDEEPAATPANDNGLEWPLIPFPDDWYVSC